jgi:hypothetical protein
MKRKTFLEYLNMREKWTSPAKATIDGIMAVLNPFAGQRRRPVVRPPSVSPGSIPLPKIP